MNNQILVLLLLQLPNMSQHKTKKVHVLSVKNTYIKYLTYL